jgi:hypothetical protein
VLQIGPYGAEKWHIIRDRKNISSGENGAENDLKTRDIRNVQRKASEKALGVVGTGSPRLGLHTVICGWGVRREDRSNVPTVNP